MIIPPSIAAAIRVRANKSGTRSFYIYDTAPMRAKIVHLKTAMPKGVEIFYAMKANPHSAFLDAAKQSGAAGIEIASLGEANAALAAGFTPHHLIFTGPGKSPEELEWSVKNGVRTVHLESLTEAHRLHAICRALGKKQDVLLRVNPNFHIHGAQASFSGDPNKLGLDERKLHDHLPKILAMDHLNFLGLHVYAASGVLKVGDLLKNCELVFALAREIESTYANARCGIIDFGGGFGVDYLETGADFSPDAYAEGLRKLIPQFGFADRTFVLELGRYLVADGGWYCTEILDIKDSLGKKQVICAGGANHFRRPAALNINHPLMIVPMQRPPVFDGQEKVSREKTFIGGPLCSTADKLSAHDIYIEEAHIGDIAVFGLAGAYGLTMSHIEFLGHPRPEEVVL
jgi:diaminopimelate decarboxylase